uniref:Zinc finger CW-type PWWP domain protein 1-like n=1 Tax=Phallusia mammillata TaxID=59560 RepID=A0A6F9DYF0_9ASCI|nr:zinc finger CW-type PWWP domain protein 1-like [Phallusia mammillata]
MKPSFQSKFNPQSQSHETKSTKKTDMEKNVGLSDEQYDDLFASVLSRSAAGNITNKEHCPTETLEGYAERIQNLSPLTVQAVNEVTPNTSPPEENNKPPKQHLLKPTKEKKTKTDNSFHKRKSLEYKSSRNKGQLSENRKHKSGPDCPKKKYLMMGVWVQCGAKDCLKWRFLPNCVDPSSLPEYWTCALNTDTEQNSCSAPEIDWTSCMSHSDDHFIYSEYNAGSIVWAKMPGYPPWPAMVDSDPDYNMFYEYDGQGNVLRYHVVFLDDNVSRAWIPSRFVESYIKNPFKLKDQTKEYREELKVAVSVADAAIQMSIEERLQKYGFEKRFDWKSGKNDWTSRRFKKSKSHHRKSSKSIKRCPSPEKDHVVPQVSPDQCKSDDNCQADEVPNQGTNDYWDSTNDEFNPSKSTHKTTKHFGNKEFKSSDLMTSKDKKGNDMSIDIKPNKSTSVPVPQPRKKPCFVAPSRMATQQSQKCVTNKDDKPLKGSQDKHLACLVVEEKLKLNSEIFTMELDTPTKNEEHLISIENPPSPILCGSDKDPSGVESDGDEPIDLSLKCGSQNSLSANEKSSKSSNISGKDFWVEQSPEKIKGKKIDDPFLGGNLDELNSNEEDERSGLMDEWEDCKLQQLDEWMPAITD